MDRKVAKLKSILSKVALRFEFRPSITALRNSTSLLERLVHSLPEMKEKKNCTYVESREVKLAIICLPISQSFYILINVHFTVGLTTKK